MMEINSVKSIDNDEVISTPPEELQKENLAELCRSCANTSNHMIPIFEGEGLQHNLYNKLTKHLPINATQDDTLPQQLCYHCAATILAFHEISEGCLQAQAKLLQIVEKVNSIQVEENMIEETEVFQHAKEDENIQVESAIEIYQPAVQELITKETDVDGDDDDEDDDKLKPSYKERCADMPKKKSSKTLTYLVLKSANEGSPAEESYSEHLEAAGDHNYPRSDNQHRDSDKIKFIDRESSEMESNSQEVKNGSKDNEPKRRRIMKGKRKKRTWYDSYPCMNCDFIAKQKKLLVKHVTERHPDLPMDECVKRPRLPKDIIKNARGEADGRVFYKCKDCEKVLFSRYTFYCHIRIHTGEKPYTCHLCGKQFRIKQGLVRHLNETHAGIKNFSCDICSRMFATKRTLEDHRRTHTGERPYVCPTCGKSFKQKASLFVHNRTHTDLFPFKCIHCNQGFRTRPLLMMHNTKHTGEKPYVCEICNRAFRIKYELKRHKLIHSDEKPWQCPYCGLLFRQKRYLANHVKSNHNCTLATSE